MGLDMYLYRKTYVKNWDHYKPEKRFQITVQRGGDSFDAIKPERIAYIVEEVGYWRKANAIHRWFVDNVQGGEDDCGEYTVSHEQLTQLRDLCRLVTPESAAELLPTTSGFFFGSTDYDRYYFEDAGKTGELLTALLAEGDDGEIYYQSSW